MSTPHTPTTSVRKPDDGIVIDFVRSVGNRLRFRRVSKAVAFAALIAAIFALMTFAADLPATVMTLGGVSVAAAAVVVQLLRRSGRSAGNAVLAVEQRFPHLNNLLQTAWELATGKLETSPRMRQRVLEQAVAGVSRIDVVRTFPIANDAILAAGATTLWVLLLLLLSPGGTVVRDRVFSAIPETLRIAGAAGVSVTVTPPAYSGLPTQQLVDPELIEALQGSTLRFTSSATDSLQFIRGDDTVSFSRASTRKETSFTLENDGFLIVRHVAEDGESRKLIVLSSRVDQLPSARITAPGRDLFITDASRVIDVGIEASDDLALDSLRLRYTKVSGSGERFTFTDGEVPITVDRTNATQWTARGKLQLAQLKLEKGDMVVYRAVVSDRRASSQTESDAFIVEIVGIGGDAAEGFSIDPDQDRYAVSQQMVVLKTERLIARRTGMDSSTLADASRELSLEQRRVRAEFVFMMGGELAEEITAENSMGDLDESHEAEGESDLSAGRMANQGRAALMAAIRAMSRAATALNVANLDQALVQERTAVRELEKAFSRTRYLLRAFTQREQLDLTRRMSGAMDEVRPGARTTISPPDDAHQLPLRQALLLLADDAVTGSSLTAAAELVIAVDPSSPELQMVSSRLSRAASMSDAGSRRLVLDSATVTLSDLLRSDGVAWPQHDMRSLEGRLLRGAIRDVNMRGVPKQ